MSDTIKEKFSKIKELNNDVYDILINDKLEFNRLERLKKGTKQSLRKYKAGGLTAIFNNLFSKKVVDRINSPSDKKKILYITITPSFNLLRQSIYVRKNGNYETILIFFLGKVRGCSSSWKNTLMLYIFTILTMN